MSAPVAAERLVRPARRLVQRCADRPPRTSCDCRERGEERAPAVVRDAVRDPGSPLPDDVAVPLAARLGHDLSRVRVHTGERAVTAVRELRAVAFTVGDDVVLDTGRVGPGAERDRVLAHELVHVVAQGGGPAEADHVAPAVGPPEHQADRIADDVVARRAQAPAGPAAPVAVEPPPAAGRAEVAWRLHLTLHPRGTVEAVATGPGLPAAPAGAVVLRRRPDAGFDLTAGGRTGPLRGSDVPTDLSVLLDAAATGGPRRTELPGPSQEELTGPAGNRDHERHRAASDDVLAQSRPLFDALVATVPTAAMPGQAAVDPAPGSTS